MDNECIYQKNFTVHKKKLTKNTHIQGVPQQEEKCDMTYTNFIPFITLP